jgi:phosphate transport system substrate-binding protein
MQSCSRTRLWLGALAFLGAALASETKAAEINGAGATFPYPVYAKWAEAYKAKTDVSMNYQSIGSGGGIKQITAKTVDFGASDMPLKPAELEKRGLAQWPMIMGGVVPVVNLPDVAPGALRLDGPTLANIYLGNIDKWDDPAIKQLNPDAKLPSMAIAPIYRSDGSGTTFIFTNYLTKVSPDFEDKVGSNAAVEWPTGVGGKGNEGVAALSARTAGAIGYVEYAFALQNKLTYVRLVNKEGATVMPDGKSFQAAAANADWQKAPGFYLLLTDQAGKDSWPISGASFILMHKEQDKPDVAKEVLDFFDWSYRNGQQLAEALAYVPVPESVVKLVEASWSSIKDPNGMPVWQAR